MFFAVNRLSLAAASRGYASLGCSGSRAQTQQLKCTALVPLQQVEASWFNQGLNLCPLHWQADS